MSGSTNMILEKKLVAVEDNYPPKDDFLRLEWNLGRTCNFDCSYCSPNIHSKKAEHLDLNVIKRTAKKFVDHAKETSRSLRISLTGGEPYLHPHFIEILKTLKQEGVNRISITSNGSVPTRLYIESLNYIDYLNISVHFEFIKIETLKMRLIEIQQNLNSMQRLHLHVMMLPGRVDEALGFADDLRELEISYILRRVRPQFNQKGLFLRPFNSGLQGGHRADWDEIKSRGLSYYTQSELESMGV